LLYHVGRRYLCVLLQSLTSQFNAAWVIVDSSDTLISTTYGLFAATPASPPNANSGLLIRSAAVLLPSCAYNAI